MANLTINIPSKDKTALRMMAAKRHQNMTDLVHGLILKEQEKFRTENPGWLELLESRSTEVCGVGDCRD